MELEDLENNNKLSFKAYVDSTLKEQKSKIETWTLNSLINIKLDSDTYKDETGNISNISFNGINVQGDKIPLETTDIINHFRYKTDYIGPIRPIPPRDLRLDQNVNKAGIPEENAYNTLIKIL